MENENKEINHITEVKPSHDMEYFKHKKKNDFRFIITMRNVPANSAERKKLFQNK